MAWLFLDVIWLNFEIQELENTSPFIKFDAVLENIAIFRLESQSNYIHAMEEICTTTNLSVSY